jgi:hypothetical protein
MKKTKVPWYELPPQKPIDRRDAEEHSAVSAALETLPPDHPAKQAYSEGADTIRLTHLVADRRDTVEVLTEAYLAGYRRFLQRQAGYFRP